MATYLPVTLFPTPVPRAVFQQALAVQPHYNLLVDLVSRDTPFLEEALARWGTSAPESTHDGWVNSGLFMQIRRCLIPNVIGGADDLNK